MFLAKLLARVGLIGDLADIGRSNAFRSGSAGGGSKNCHGSASAGDAGDVDRDHRRASPMVGLTEAT